MFTIGAVLTVVFSVVGYLVLRAYIYGDDAPPIPVFDGLGG